MSETSSTSSKFKKSGWSCPSLPLVKAKYPLILDFLGLKSKYIKFFFEKFHSLSGPEMFNVVDKKDKLGEVLSSKPISYQMLKKYVQMHKTEKLYSHFFKTNTRQNDDVIQLGLVGTNPEKGDSDHEQGLLHLRARRAPGAGPIQTKELDIVSGHDIFP